MFKLATDPKFTHVVTVSVPVDGGHTLQTFKATYRVLPIEELGEWATLDGQRELLVKVLCGLDDLVGDDGQELPYSDELRDQLLSVPFVRAPLVKTYVDAITKAPAGN